MPVADEKKYLRSILKRTRDSIASGLAATLSARIQASLLDADFYRSSRADATPLLLYSAIANEVATDTILDDALASGRPVYFPRLDCTKNTLSIGRVQSRADLTAGAHGILEPKTSPFDLSSMPRSIIVVPGVAFTIRGERLGRGGGHYDRLLAELPPQAIKVGLAYSFQLLDSLPQSGWDQQLNFVVTEAAIYSAPEATWRDGGVRSQGGIPR